MLSKESVLAALQTRGPSIPIHIKKVIGEGDTFTIGALLSELTAGGKVKVSNVKRGGSPYYYVPEHASRLVECIEDLGEKDRRAARLLQERKILRDKNQDPLLRVCLRNIKDYSRPLEVKTKEGTELFWKWYLTPQEEAITKIREALGMPQNPPAQQVKPEEAQPVKVQDTKAAEAEKPSEVQQEQHQEPTPTSAPTPVANTPRQENLTAEEQEKPKPQAAATLLKEIDDSGDSFLRQLLEYFAEKHIQIITKDVVRKNGEVDLEISVPTAVGRVDYYCKAKNKKKSNDGDLASAYVQGSLKKLPIIYLTTGEVTKKAKEMMHKEFRGMVLVQL